MKRETRKKWERANYLASIPCGMSSDNLSWWAWEWTFQMDPPASEMVAASLALDGCDIRELP